MMEEAQIRAFVMQSEMLRTWQIESILGSGKKSIVYQIARETEKEKTVSALKVICVMPEPDDVEYLKSIGLTPDAIERKYKKLVDRCRDEIRIMQQLQGEAYILNCLDFEEVRSEGKPGAMLMIREEKLTPLKDALSQTPLSESRILQIALCVAKALETCHYHQPAIIHGDVKPDNIFWLRDDIYKIGDFGVSAFLKETDAQQQGGTPDYEAPEKRSKGMTTPKTDIYALGRTIERLLEGQNPGTSSALRRFAAQMTAENPEDRPENIRQVIEELKKMQANPSSQWDYQQRENRTETQTDSLESKVNRPNEDESIIPEESEQKIEQPVTEASQALESSISQELDDEEKKRLEAEKRKKIKTWIIIVTIMILVAAAAIGVIHHHRTGQAALTAELTLEKDPTDYGLMTGLLYSYPKDCGYDGADQHEKLIQESLLTRILSGSNLPVTQLQSNGQGVYLHLSAANGFSEPMDNCKVALLCETKTVIVTMTAKDGGCGIFGQNLLFVRLDEVLNQAKDSLVSGQSYELRVYSSKGLLFNMNGTIQ